jgi:hypothetical protein
VPGGGDTRPVMGSSAADSFRRIGAAKGDVGAAPDRGERLRPVSSAADSLRVAEEESARGDTLGGPIEGLEGVAVDVAEDLETPAAGAGAGGGGYFGATKSPPPGPPEREAPGEVGRTPGGRAGLWPPAAAVILADMLERREVGAAWRLSIWLRGDRRQKGDRTDEQTYTSFRLG